MFSQEIIQPEISWLSDPAKKTTNDTLSSQGKIEKWEPKMTPVRIPVKSPAKTVRILFFVRFAAHENSEEIIGDNPIGSQIPRSIIIPGICIQMRSIEHQQHMNKYKV